MENSTTPDLLHDLADEITYEHASKAMRLVNFIIDMIIVLDRQYCYRRYDPDDDYLLPTFLIWEAVLLILALRWEL